MTGQDKFLDQVTALLPALRRARDLIDREYAEPLDLDALARADWSRLLPQLEEFGLAAIARAAVAPQFPLRPATRRNADRRISP